MKKQLLGVIDATAYFEDLEDLIAHRSLAALPIAGRYRLIDFALSNMVNSGIRSVAIFPNGQYRSLSDHLGSGENWDLARKRDGLFLFSGSNLDLDRNCNGSFHYFAANLDFFIRSTQEYSIIANCYTVMNMEFEPLLHHHMESGCDITEIINQDGFPLEMYLLKTSLLIQLIETRKDTGYTSIRDVINLGSQTYSISRYIYKEYSVMIDSLQTYYDTSMNLLQPDIRNHLFKRNQPIYTKVKDEPPTHYLNGSSVRNSMIANGCIIKGQVANSIVAREVQIGEGSIIKNSIISKKCRIGENCYLESVILDKEVKIETGTVLTAVEKSPYVVRKGTIQGALMNL